MTALLLAMLAAPPLGFSLIPPDLDLNPPTKPVECSESMTTFDADPVPFDVVIDVSNEGKDWKLRPGILLSECGFVHIINIKAEHKRLQSEVESLLVLKTTRERQWTQAEMSYQKSIVKLQDEIREANKPSFWEEWDGPIMYVGGILTAGLIVWGTLEIYSALDVGR